MTKNGAAAYACVAYGVMEEEKKEISEEYLSVLLEILYEFYTEKEIKKIYEGNICFDCYEAVINEDKIKNKIK